MVVPLRLLSQSQVHNVIRQKRELYAKEREESARIAASHPLIFPASQDVGHGNENNGIAEAPRFTSVVDDASSKHLLEAAVFSGTKSSAYAEDESSPKKNRSSSSGRSLPSPLSEVLLFKAMPELSKGASMSIQTCLDCWRAKRLSDSDLLSTVRSFAGSSPSLSKAFSEAEAKEDNQSCVATLEDMLALAQLSRNAMAMSR